jgi:TRAP-type C4-dicarboxylate transport system permease large subunit
MIPPSSGLIIYGILTETSIGKLFVACIIPGLIVMLCFIAVIVIQVKIKPSLAPRVETHVSWGERIKALVDVLPVIILFVFVIGGMFGGLFSTTEAAAVGCVGAFVIMLTTGISIWRQSNVAC